MGSEKSFRETLIEKIAGIVAERVNIESLVDEDYGASLRRLARVADPRGVILELGIGRGSSGVQLCLGAAEGTKCTVYGVDNFSMLGTSPSIALAQFQIHRVKERMLLMDTAEAAEVWSLPISLLFIDADHSYEGCKADFENFFPFVIGNGIVVFHDSEREPVKRVIEENSDLLYECIEKFNPEGYGCFYSLKRPANG